ncbi:MAG: ABC transporter substrate-binding protein [Bacillota bacterium]|jgi:ABC-type nitrate/sulfonate/bicarbonate transport system substrate-binding protein
MHIKWGLSPRGLYNMGVYLGKKKGFFNFPGSYCIFYENISGADYRRELINGTFDMGTCGTPPLLAAFAHTKEYVLIGQANCNYPPFYLIADNSVSQIKDLRGKTIGINKFGTCSDSLVRTILSEAGISVADVNITALNVSYSEFAEVVVKQRIEACMQCEPWVSYFERVLNWRIIVDCTRSIRESNYAYLIYVKKSLLNENPSLVSAYRDAYAKSIKYAKENINELMVLDYSIDNIHACDLESAINREVPLWNENPSLDDDILANAVRELKRQGILPGEFCIQEYIYRGFENSL